MLVPQKTVDSWYLRTSWVYQNFAFLFVNPWWTRKIPGGFSVCPYFWLSLFSFLLLRPFIAIVTAIASPVMKVGGPPFRTLDGWCLRWLQTGPLTMTRLDEVLPGRGIGITLTVAVALAALLVLAVVGLMGCVIVHGLITLAAVPGGLFAILLTSSAIATVVGVYRYLAGNSHRADRCRAEVWLSIWIAAALVLCGIFGPVSLVEAAGLVWWFLASCVDLVCFVASCVWKYGLVPLAGMLWILLKLLGILLFGLLTWAPFKALWMLPWWTYVAATAWVMSRNLDPMPTSATPLDVAANRQRWLRVLVAGYQDGHRSATLCRQVWRHLCEMLAEPVRSPLQAWPVEVDNDLLARTIELCAPCLYARHVGIALAPVLDLLEAVPCTLNPYCIKKELASYDADLEIRKRLAKVLSPEVYEQVVALLPCELVDIWGHTGERNSLGVALLAQPGVTADLLEGYLLCQKYARQEAEEAAVPGWMEQLCIRWETERRCQQVTGAVSRMMRRFADLAADLWSACCTFGSYLWILAKARKQGACPYMRFTDSPDTKP